MGTEHRYIDEALATGKISGNGVFGRRCASWLRDKVGASAAMITPSCTAALEMSGILGRLEPGDEVIVPAFTFVSTANAFALRGAVPVFVDIDEATLNIDPGAIERAITKRTRAIVVVHYAGIACDMDAIMAIASRHGLIVIEDAAHALPAWYGDRPLGSIGHLSTFSFHETKNLQCGEGGALLVNDPELVQRAEIVQEKGTNRSRFFRGEVDKYTWLDIGSSYLLSEVGAAFLWAQIEYADAITAERVGIWERYYEAFAELEDAGLVRRPVVPAECRHSGHLFYLLLPSADERDDFIRDLRRAGVHSVFHYLPLNLSPGGRRFGREPERPVVTESVSDRLVRLPLWSGLGEERTEQVVDAVRSVVTSGALRR
ncbi:MAG: TDP-4-keto-6-deoxy-D-glucose transaminase [Conexibacter sp.]|nr:TDP-4-keto-6-deoxy-D-glucose transaminase [Conexibacter sp.]